MLTYNHQPYVEQAIRSVLSQVLADTVEMTLLVGDDASPDGTADVIARLAEQHPKVVSPVLRRHNLGMFGNVSDLWSRCDGDYIAVLEGDDYWISPTKLQDQIDAMEQHRQWALSFHRAEFVDAAGAGLGAVFPDDEALRGGVGARSLAVTNFIPNNAVMYRQGLLDTLPTWLEPLPLLDWPIHLLHADRGGVGFLDTLGSAYRVHPGGVWSALSIPNRLGAVEEMATTLLSHEWSRDIRSGLITRLGETRHSLAVALLEAGDRATARRAYLRSLSYRTLDRNRFRERAQLIARLYRPTRGKATEPGAPSS